MKRSVVIVGGGIGSRMGSETPKQFLDLSGKPVIIWTIEKFVSFDPDIKVILVLPESHMIVWHELIAKYKIARKVRTTGGGATRYHSVSQGLAHVGHNEIVAIHDAVRPLVTLETLERCYNDAEKFGSAIPVIDTEDSLREIRNEKSQIIDRNMIKRVQTPQAFQAKKLLTAYENCVELNYTDDATVYESYFGEVHLVEGDTENIKITFPSDMKIAEAILSRQAQ